MSCTLLADLSVNTAISKELIAKTRAYIASKYPCSSNSERAAILFNAINRVIENHLPDIDLEQKEKLKKQIFKDTCSKDPFFIDYSDIFNATLSLKLCGNSFFHGISKWLSQSLNVELDRIDVYTFFHKVYEMKDLNNENEIESIIEKVEDEYGYLIKNKSENIVDTLADDTLINLTPSQVLAPPITIPLYTGTKEYNTEVTPEMKVNSKSTVNNLQTIRLYDIIKRFIPLKTEFFHPSKLHIRNVATSFFIVCLSSTIFLGASTVNSFGVKKANSPSEQVTQATIEKEDTNNSTNSPILNTIIMKATAYDLSMKSCGKSRSHPYYGITATGTRASVGRTIAVDPAFIPLGTSVYVTFPELYNYLDGIYIAEDTGSSIKGDRIDVYFGEDTVGSYDVYNKAINFGIQNVTVEIIDNKPNQ